MKLFQTTIYAFLLSPGRLGSNEWVFFKNPAFIEQNHDGGEPRCGFGMGACVMLEIIRVVNDGCHG